MTLLFILYICRVVIEHTGSLHIYTEFLSFFFFPASDISMHFHSCTCTCTCTHTHTTDGSEQRETLATSTTSFPILRQLPFCENFFFCLLRSSKEKEKKEKEKRNRGSADIRTPPSRRKCAGNTHALRVWGSPKKDYLCHIRER